MVHTNAPRGACQITVKCRVKTTDLKCCVGESSSNGTETSLTQVCLTGMIICETQVKAIYIDVKSENDRPKS